MGLMIALLGTAVLADEKSADHLFIISIDGLRPDALQRAVTPNIDTLWQNGAYSWRAQTIFPSTTLPSHVSMLTGLRPEKHRVIWNFWNPRAGYVHAETVFEIARRAGLKTAMFVGKQKLQHIAKPNTVDRFDFPGYAAETVMGRAVTYIAAERPQLVFIHLADPDGAGHSFGWMSNKQIEAIETVDRVVGQLITTLHNLDLFDRSLIIITADHGGHGKTHGSRNPLDMTIPWIIHGSGIRRGYRIPNDVRTYDTAATALFALGLSVPEGWDGRPVCRAFITPRDGAPPCR
ncbi:MAG: ectonucleotide pyrophosphatase/phosphodiesterase [Candidatus Bipolaricaulia bacterium]